MKSNQMKKARQRNRPRNKANRLKLLADDNEEMKGEIKDKGNFIKRFLVNVQEEEGNAQDECMNYDDMPELIDENVILQENITNRSVEQSFHYQKKYESFENERGNLLCSDSNLLKEKIMAHEEYVVQEKRIDSKKCVEELQQIKQLKNYSDRNESNKITFVKKKSDSQSRNKECEVKILESPSFEHYNSGNKHFNKNCSYKDTDAGNNKLEKHFKTEEKSKNDEKFKVILNEEVIEESDEGKENSIQLEEEFLKKHLKQMINLNESIKCRKEEGEKKIREESADNNDLPELADERFENINIEEKFEQTNKVYLTNENLPRRKEQADEKKEKCAAPDQSDLRNRNQNKAKNELNKLEFKGPQQQQNSKKIKTVLTNRSHKCQEKIQTTEQKVEESTLKKLIFEKNSINAMAESAPTSKEMKMQSCNLEMIDFGEKPKTPQKQNPMQIQGNVKAVKNSCDNMKKTNVNEKNAFIQNLQQQMEAMMAKGNDELPTTLMENLQKLFNQTPISDIETSDEEEEYVEYIYKPRKYFLISLCSFCKTDLLYAKDTKPCSRCNLTYYCCADHMKKDSDHRQFCYAIKNLSNNNDGRHVFYKCSDFTPEQFRSYRIVIIKQLEKYINRPLALNEQEIILFSRLCLNNQCREYRFEKLKSCQKCGMVAYCTDKVENQCQMAKTIVKHQNWCQTYQLFKQFIIHQEKFGRLEPSMPSKVLKEFPVLSTNTKDILKKLNLDLPEANCEYAALTQISTVPLTAWYALKVCDKLKDQRVLTIHLIGAEIEFEVDLLHKWELFFLHITPALQQLNVIFIGPELDPKKISFDQLSKTKCCRLCRKSERLVTYRFITKMYHDYCRTREFLKPNLICFFNAGLYRSSGYNMEDTWPATIYAASQLNVPVVVSAYTEYEMPLDMQRFVQESNRHVNVIMPPHLNPFTSIKPERNFISDDVAPLIFKNYYCFIVE